MEDNALQELPGGWQVAFRFWSALCQLDDDWCQVRVWWTMPICTRAAGTPNSGSELLAAEPTSTIIVNVILFHGSNFLVQDHPVFALCGRGLRKLSTGTQRFCAEIQKKNFQFVICSRGTTVSSAMDPMSCGCIKVIILDPRITVNSLLLQMGSWRILGRLCLHRIFSQQVWKWLCGRAKACATTEFREASEGRSLREV